MTVQSTPVAAQVAPNKKDIITVQIPRSSSMISKVQPPTQLKQQQQQLCTQPVSVEAPPLSVPHVVKDGQIEIIFMSPTSNQLTTSEVNSSLEGSLDISDTPTTNGEEEQPVEPLQNKSRSSETTDLEEFIVEEGGISFEEENSETSERVTDAKQDVVAEEEPRDETLEWYNKPKIENQSQEEAPAVDAIASGAFQVEIERGRIKSQTPGSDGQDLITMMHRGECIPTLAFDMNYINKKSLDSWKPSQRNKRLKTDTCQGTKESQKLLKRKWSSMDRIDDQEIDVQFKRKKSPDLQCDESIVGNSSDDLSDPEPADVSTETVLMPESVKEDVKPILENGVDIKKEPMDFKELPLMQEGYQMFNSEENTLEATTLKVRECFRPLGPSEMNHEPIGFDFLHWRANVGVLFGSNLSFFLNEVGLLDVKLSKQAPQSRSPSPEQANGLSKQSHRTKEEKSEWNKARDNFWDSYMESKGSFAAPRYLFRHTLDEEHPVETDMVVELIDPENVGEMAYGTVEELLGGRMTVAIKRNGRTSVHYMNKNSWKVFPVGFMKAHKMLPMRGEVKKPRGTPYENAELIKRMKVASAFKVSMQLEAFDYLGTGTLRPARVSRIIGRYLLIVFDGEKFDNRKLVVPKNSFWCRDDSPLIRPPYYHVEMDMPLGKTRQFKWRRYVKNQGTSLAPASAFQQRTTLPFREGMQLEVVDRINPQVMRPATVKQVLNLEIKIQYDGFPEEKDNNFDVWLCDDSEDIFPVGWCFENRHILIAHNQATHCLRSFCGDVGNKNPWRLYHATLESCPYKLPGFMSDSQRDPNLASRFTQHPKLEVNRGQDAVDTRDAVIAALEKKVKSQAEKLKVLNAVSDYGPSKKNYNDLWKKHSELALGKMDRFTRIFDWTSADVKAFVDSIPNCRYLGSVFVHHDVDGEALLSLTERDLLDILGLKQGLATKIYNAIIGLRIKVASGMF